MDNSTSTDTVKNMKYNEEVFENITHNRHADSETALAVLPGEFRQHPVIHMDRVLMDRLGQLFDHCIQQVSRLETQRNQHIQELLGLHEPMLRGVVILRRELGQTQRMLTAAQLGYTTVSEEVERVKRKLFTTARDCIQSQVTLAAQQYEVAQSVITQEEFKAHIQSLTLELAQLREANQNQLTMLRAEATKPQRSRTVSDVGLCRQASIRLQRRLSGSMEALGGWYEPRLMALLRRRQMGENLVRKIREQTIDLRAKLEPLREEMQRLEVQRACLEQRLSLMEKEREERVTEYEGTINILQETLRGLQVECDVQKKLKKDLEERNNFLLSELVSLRGPDELEETTAETDPYIFVSSGYF